MMTVDHMQRLLRKTSQELAPVYYSSPGEGLYDLYPSFTVPDGQIDVGYEALAAWLSRYSTVTLEGPSGVLWELIRERLDQHLRALGVIPTWQAVAEALRPPSEIESLIEPFLGGDDPIFGTRFTSSLRDFFDTERLHNLRPSGSALDILYGTGAALAGWNGALVYIDVPKNEIQFRSRAGSITNIGATQPDNPKRMYKRFYFVDWVAMREHSALLLPDIDLFVDSQRPDTPTLMRGDHLRAGLEHMSQSFFRVRPWFEPGAWGGQWIKEKIPHLPQDVPNYAWSFELISPENGIMFRSNNVLLEVSFDFLMFHASRSILGSCAERFGYEFPIRFDFLDTFSGGNLSVQCHPSPEYARQHFGERFTQDETYYILDCKPGAEVFLGFKDDIDPDTFRSALEESFAQGTPIDIDRFVNRFPTKRGDLFLIPYGTVHCSGANNLVLEISATPYIFTFKMYDWMRLDLDGMPRPLNIARAFENLNFTRKGERVRVELLSQPRILSQGDDWKLIHLPTHPDHFYDIHRMEFSGTMQIDTQGSCHVLNLVEGPSVLLETASGDSQRFSFAETFVVPAAASSYRLISESAQPIKVVKSFIKP